MKNLILFFILIISLNVLAQEYPKVEEISVKQKVIPVCFEKDHNANIYLHYYKSSKFSSQIYSVVGWYESIITAEKYPLVGVYYGDLTLYMFPDTVMDSLVLNFEEEYLNCFEEKDYYTNLSGWDSKIVINGDSNKIYIADQESDLILFDDYKLNNIYEYLFLDEDNVFDLQFLSKNYNNFKLIGYNDHKYLLKYSYLSNSNIYSRCYNNNEEGMLLLKFDKNKRLLDYEFIKLQSCCSEISYEIVEKNDTSIIFIVEYNDNLRERIIVDTKNVNINCSFIYE